MSVEILSQEDEKLLPIIDQSVNEAMSLHLFGISQEKAGVSFSEIDDDDFTEIVRANRNPLNPAVLARDVLGFPEGTPMRDIQAGLKNTYDALITEYKDNGVDPALVLEAARDTIDLTEGYISGYSRILGSFATKLMLVNPEAVALHRWVSGVWVPEEDKHDRILSILHMALDEKGMEPFYAKHTRYMHVGIGRFPTSIPQTTSYLRKQEGLTGETYRNYAALLGPILSGIAKRIGADEHRHTRFYRKLDEDVLRADPERALVARVEEDENFSMPGERGIEDFNVHARVLGIAGVLDLTAVHDAKASNLKTVESLEVKTDEAKQAKDQLLDPSGVYGKAKRTKIEKLLTGKRERVIESAKRAGNLLPAILGVTVVADPVSGKLSFPMSR